MQVMNNSLLMRAGLSLGTSAVALLVAALLFDRFSVGFFSFPIVVVIFTVVGMVAKPLAAAILERWTQSASWAIGLLATWLTLLVTDLVSDGLQIEGLFTWVVSTVIVWVGLIVADDGVGLDVEKAQGVGFASMRERAAKVGAEIAFTPNEPHGLTVEVRLPGGSK